jgi:hypothetical protein
MIRKNIYRLTLIVVLLFVFFAPVVPMTVPHFWLLPWWNQCTGIIGPESRSFGSASVFASISAFGFGTLFSGRPLFGLVYVPNNSWDSIQFPPIGYPTIMCA